MARGSSSGQADGYGAIFGSEAFAPATGGQYRGTEWRLSGPRVGCAVIAGSEARDGGFAAFRARCRGTGIVWQDDALKLPEAGLLVDGSARSPRDLPVEPTYTTRKLAPAPEFRTLDENYAST